MDKEKCFQLASESVNRMNSMKWWWQIVPSSGIMHACMQ